MCIGEMRDNTRIEHNAQGTQEAEVSASEGMTTQAHRS